MSKFIIHILFSFFLWTAICWATFLETYFPMHWSILQRDLPLMFIWFVCRTIFNLRLKIEVLEFPMSVCQLYFKYFSERLTSRILKVLELDWPWWSDVLSYKAGWFLYKAVLIMERNLLSCYHSGQMRCWLTDKSSETINIPFSTVAIEIAAERAKSTFVD